MNSLEYITAKIEWLTSKIKRFKERIDKYNDKDLNKEDLAEVEHLNNWLEHYKEELQMLQQIETELEAWEIVKPRIHHVEEQKCFVIQTIISNNQYDFIKKALEIQDE